MTWLVAILLIIGGAYGLGSEVVRRKNVARLARRPCAGRRWRSAFPYAGKDEIRRFLSLVVEAFDLADEARLKITPDDALLGIYRIVNPPRWTFADDLELERFVAAVDRVYGLKLETIWHDELTLGQVFARVAANPSGRA